MIFTVTVDLGTAGYFEFSTESLFELAEIAQMLGNTDVVEEEDSEDTVDVPDNIAEYFDDEEEYMYDEVNECYCWYDEEYDAWYWLDENTGEWLLVEDAVETSETDTEVEAE